MNKTHEDFLLYNILKSNLSTETHIFVTGEWLFGGFVTSNKCIKAANYAKYD